MAQDGIVKINAFSDGDASHIPNTSTHRQYKPPTLYLEKLGTLWMTHRKEAQPGFTYRIDRLPDGYTVWERPRPSNTSHVDRWCYGHPTKKWFDSPNRFFSHFLNLMEKGSTQACDCINCDKTKKPSRSKAPAIANTSAPRNTSSFFTPLPAASLPVRRPRRPPDRLSTGIDLDVALPTTETKAGVYKAKGRQWVEGRTDEEGTPDPYRNNIDRLKTLGVLDTIIEEPMSADWRAERASNVEQYFEKLKQQNSWLPRRMEIVLMVRALKVDERLVFSPEHKRFMIVDKDDSASKEPLWEAGVVTQTPLTTDMDDNQAITNSGFRVEPLSNANTKEGKGIWKRYCYLRYDQIRPFNLWENFLAGTDTNEWDETIMNAMLVMSTLTLVKRYRFKGKWPSAKVFCRAMYLGAELIMEGDYVNLFPESNFDAGVTDIMQIDSITLDMWNLGKASNDDYDEGHPYNCTARATGRIFTNTAARAINRTPTQLINTSLHRIGPWYARTPDDKLSRVPFHRVMGRCYNPDVVDIWVHGEKSKGDPVMKVGLGMSGVISARKFCSAEYKRIEDNRNWYWADTRVEALNLEEINGFLVTNQDPDRDPKKYRREIRVIEGTARPEERLALQQQAERRASTRGINGMLAGALELNAEESAETSRDRKRSRSALGRSEESGEEEEDNKDTIRKQFVDQMAEGLAMSDEEVPSENDENDIDDSKRVRASIVIPTGQ
jgi:hypothetical protein